MELILVIIHDVVNRNDIGMVEFCGSLSFILEFPDEIFVFTVLFLQYLDGHCTAHLGIFGTVNKTHASLTDEGVNFISVIKDLTFLNHHDSTSSP